MATSNTTLTHPIDLWLRQWAEWLDLWIESGSDAPGESAIAALKTWAENKPTSNFEAIEALLNVLLSSHASRAERADALLDLMVKHRAMRRIRQASQVGSIN